MAISVPAVSQANFTKTTGANVTVTFPTASMALGDWIYVIGGHFRRAGTSIGPTTGVWETVYSENAGGSTNAFGCWRKQWNGVETSVDCYGSGTAGDGVAYGRIILRGSGSLKATTPATGASTNPNPPSVTTVAGDCVLIAAQSTVSDASPGTVANYTTVNGNANGTKDMSLSMGYRLAPATTEDPAAWSSWSTGNWRTLSIVLAPAVLGTGALAAQAATVAGMGTVTSAAVTGTGTLAAQSECGGRRWRLGIDRHWGSLGDYGRYRRNGVGVWRLGIGRFRRPGRSGGDGCWHGYGDQRRSDRNRRASIADQRGHWRGRLGFDRHWRTGSAIQRSHRHCARFWNWGAGSAIEHDQRHWRLGIDRGWNAGSAIEHDQRHRRLGIGRHWGAGRANQWGRWSRCVDRFWCSDRAKRDRGRKRGVRIVRRGSSVDRTDSRILGVGIYSRSKSFQALACCSE